MKQKHRQARNDAGMALLMGLVFISILVLMLTTLTTRYIQQRLQMDRFEDQYMCFEVAEAGIEQGKSAINNGEYTLSVGIPEGWEAEFDSNNILILPGFDDYGVTPASLATVPDVEYMIYIHRWEDDGRDTNGDGTVDSDAEEGIFSIHAAARKNGLVRRLEAVYNSRDFGIWNNAVFAGRGQVGGLINGNVKIHGSVHLLGDDLPEGAPAVTALDLSGAAMISNDYMGIVPQLAARVPGLKSTNYLGESVTTMDTELRVRNGIVEMSGNANVGVEWTPGSGYKGPVDGTYVTDGWGGNSGTSRVFSDNSTDQPYDLGNSLDLPGFDDDWIDSDTGEKVLNPNTGVWYTHTEYFAGVLVGGPDKTAAGGTFNGDVSIRAATGFYYNATTGEYKTGTAADGITPNPEEHYILKKTTSPIIQINGAIHINGNLNFPDKIDISYYGRAAIMVEGSVNVDSGLLSSNSPTDVNDYNASFPYTSCIGIMSRGDIGLGILSQRQMMGAFYTAGDITMSKQTQLMGTIVAQNFDMGNQVPDIFQVPVLARNLPLGMVGDYPIIRVKLASWREIGLL